MDKRTLLHFSNDVVDTFSRYIQAKDSDCEAGGLILGSVHGQNMLIKEVTEPTINDKRFRCLFERMPFGHEAMALAKWTTSKGVTRYLGEWHTHPEDDPSPSTLDRAEWKSLAEKRIDKRPLLVVIVGRKSLYVELVQSNGKGSVLVPIS
ncbi:Mov34/MPN/PAD-1 family protein [Marinomonas atlantica]|uniref:Mov34/MPN/PAD-1 family protein n=1 Tax=Marinomonas atlantica TaxID=1806668 RepID=UPI000A80AAE3|nr:Mov34/MPN/PAD-1 family protein [Marinomonas atlantica]